MNDLRTGETQHSCTLAQVSDYSSTRQYAIQDTARTEPSARTAAACITPGAGEVQNRLERELIERGFKTFSFVRAPPEYYERPLEFRMDCVGAASTAHLCKSMIMVRLSLIKRPTFMRIKAPPLSGEHQGSPEC